MLKRMLLLFSLCIALAYNLYARGASQTLSMPTFNDEGNQAQPFRVIVGSQTPVVQPWVSSTKNTRAIIIQNPSASYALYVSTWALFTDNDIFFYVNPGSGTLSLANNTTFYFKYGQNGTSETVRGVILNQTGVGE